MARIGASTNGERLLVCLTACVGPNNTLQHRLGETRHMNGRLPSINHTSRFEQDTCLSVFALLLSTCQETCELSPHGGNACAYDDGTRADRRFGTDRIIVYPRRGCVYLFVFLQSRYVQLATTTLHDTQDVPACQDRRRVSNPDTPLPLVTIPRHLRA